MARSESARSLITCSAATRGSYSTLKMASSLEGDLDGSQTEKLAHFQVRNRTEWSPKCAGRIPAGTDGRHERRRVETNSRKIRLESGGTERIKRASPSIIRILDRRRIGSQRKRRRRIASTTRNATPSLRSSPRRLRRRSDARSRRPSTVRRKLDIRKSRVVREFRVEFEVGLIGPPIGSIFPFASSEPLLWDSYSS